MEPGRQGRQRAPESIRKQKRRELDARRSKCRIRIGRHLEQWCTLKERLGFSLHSQLAKYLLDWYSSQGCVLSAEQGGSLPTDALQRLVALSHAHSQECSVLPAVKTPAAGETGAPWSLVWECLAGHTFSWGPPAGAEQGRAPPAAGGQPCRAASRRRKEREGSSQPSPPSSPVASRRRSLRQAALARDASGAAVKAETSPTGDSAAVRETEAPSPTGSADHSAELGAGSAGAEAAPLERAESGTEGTELESAPGLENRSEEAPAPPEDEDEDFTEEDDLAYTDDLRDENYHPSLDRACEGPFPGLASSVIGEPPVPAWNLFLRPSCPSSDSELQRECSQDKRGKSPVKGVHRPSEPGPDDDRPPEEKAAQFSCKKRRPPSDEDVAQIGPKRIRKAAKREILLCEFEGCGKIFSNRQYLNHHKKYQHVHQKTFTCSAPSCGKSFNFKKHLKEHEKLHSDKRDYICEFCARSFRTSSNLIIHRRIHTGEKPLQCEICGFTCRQKASLNWHMRKHDADAFYLFSCELCGKKFEKRDNVTAHKSKSHPWAAAAAAGPAPPPPPPDGPSPCCRRPPAAALSPCKLEEEEVPVAGE